MHAFAPDIVADTYKDTLADESMPSGKGRKKKRSASESAGVCGPQKRTRQLVLEETIAATTSGVRAPAPRKRPTPGPAVVVPAEQQVVAETKSKRPVRIPGRFL